jgi:hypothetical protein
MDKIQKEFEKWWKEWYAEDIELTTIVKADARYVFKAGYKSRDEEIKKLRAALEKIWDIAFEGINNTDNVAFEQIGDYCEQALKDGE